jgi:hypothetical protein
VIGTAGAAQAAPAFFLRVIAICRKDFAKLLI